LNGSPRLLGVVNPFDAAVTTALSVPSVLAPAPSGRDDYATLQALVNSYNRFNIFVRLRQGEYLVSQKLIPFPGSPLLLVGSGHRYLRSDGTAIKLTANLAPGNAVVDLTENYSSIIGLRIDANRRADYALYVHADVSHLVDVGFTGALLDGVHCSATGVNQAIETSYLFSYENGKLYATAAILGQYATAGSALVRQPAITGTATTVAGGDTITIASGPDLTTLGIRAGDIIRVGSVAITSYFGQIASVTANTIVVQPLLDNRPTISASGQDYAIGIGWGWFEELNGDGGFCYLNHSWFRANGAGGIFNNSLYGDKITDSYADFNCSAGIALGTCYNAGTLREPFVSGVYVEGGIGPDYVLGNVLDGHILNPGGGGVTRITWTCGSQAQIALHRHGRVESIQLGARQNLLLEFRDNAGTIEHRIVADHFGGFASLEADKIVGASAAWTTTPTVDGTHNFAAGVGIYNSGAGLVPILNVDVDQNFGIGGIASIEFDSTGSAHYATTSTTSLNVNGTTRVWPVIFVTDSSGAIVGINITTLTAGKSIGIRFSGYLK